MAKLKPWEKALEKKRENNINKWGYFSEVLIILIIVFCYFIKYLIDKSSFESIVSIVVNGIVGVIGFLAIFLSIQTDRNIKKYEYVEDYNFNFLTSKEFLAVERKLETCYQHYKRLKMGNFNAGNRDDNNINEKRRAFEKYCDSVFGTIHCQFSDIPGRINSRVDKDGCISEQYQQIINYLVYLESFVPLLINNQIELEQVDDLFGYRYFIAVNNPVIQRNELLRECEYYLGCYKIYSRWKNVRKGVSVPLEIYDLLSEYDNRDTYETELMFLESCKGRQLKNNSDLSDQQYEKIAKLIFDTDLYINPAILGQEEGMNNAVAILTDVLKHNKDTIFNKNNLYIYENNTNIVGIILWHKGKTDWSDEPVLSAAKITGKTLLKENVDKVKKEYFDHYREDDNYISLLNVCVNKEDRGKGIGKLMISDFLQEHPDEKIKLRVLKSNDNAIQLYESLGFKKDNDDFLWLCSRQ